MAFLSGIFLFLMTGAALPIKAQGPLRVITTTSDLAYYAKEVGKERVRVENLVPGSKDPHYVDARPDFIMKTNKADVFCQIGFGLEEGWVPVVLRQSRNPKVMENGPGYCDASHGVDPLEVPTNLSRSGGHIHAKGNPHYHLDPVNAVIAARNIRDALIRVDPRGESFYQANFANFANRMKELTIKEIKQFSPYKGTSVAVYHKEYIYFARRFGMDVSISIEEKPGVPPSGSYLKEVVEHIRRKKIKVILLSPYNNLKYANTVARRTGAKVLILPVSVDSTAEANTYEKVISISLEKIRQAL